MTRAKHRRPVHLALLALLLIVAGACSFPASHYPANHDERLRKAAGVVTFRIACTKDLWERTSDKPGFDTVTARSVVAKGGGVIQVELSGPQLVDYLTVLGREAFSAGAFDPLAERMYNAIAPEVDKIRGPLRPGDPVPEVSVNDAVAPAPSASAAATPAVSTPK